LRGRTALSCPPDCRERACRGSAAEILGGMDQRAARRREARGCTVEREVKRAIDAERELRGWSRRRPGREVETRGANRPRALRAPTKTIVPAPSHDLGGRCGWRGHDHGRGAD